MKKKHFRFGERNRRVSDYLCQLSVVVLGIIITFAGSSLISNCITQNKLKTALRLLVTELETNQQTVVDMKARYERERDFGQYLHRYKHDFAQASDDTLNEHQYLFFQINETSPMTEAFEMLKTSGLLQEISDQHLILQILTTYKNIQHAYSNYAFYYDNKSRITEMLNDQPQYQRWLNGVDLQRISAREMYAYLMSNAIFARLYRLPSGCINSEESFGPAITSTTETIRKISETYGL